MALQTRIVVWASLIALLSFCQINGQSYLVHTYSEANGLANSMVYDLCQDHLGQMWFATRAGISVYDGSKWKSYSVGDGLSSSVQLGVAVDRDGTIWSVNNRQFANISYFTGERWETIRGPGFKLPNDELALFKIFYFNQQRYFVFGTGDNGLFVYDGENWKNWRTENGLLHDRVKGVIAFNNQLWVATENGISVIEGDRIDNSLVDRLNLPGRNICGIELKKSSKITNQNNEVWLVGKDWIGAIVNDKFTPWLTDITKWITIGKNHVRMLVDDFGGLYIGNLNELYYCHPQSKHIELLNQNSGLISDGVTDFFLDREKNVWVSSLKGVSKIVSMQFKKYRKRHNLLENEVASIAEYQPGKMIFGHKNGVTFFDDRSSFPLPLTDSFSQIGADTRVLDIAVDRKGDIFLAASKLGLLKFKSGKPFESYEKILQFDNPTTSVLIDNADKLWVLNDRRGLYRLDDNKPVFVGPPGDEKRYYRKLFQGPNNALAVATLETGLFIYQDGKWSQFASQSNFSANDVCAYLVDSQDRIWVGTKAGLYTISHDSLAEYSADKLQIRRPVYLIFEDNQYRIWFGTNFGVYCWDGIELRHYSVNEGLSGNEINRSAGIVDYFGNIWIGTDQGVSCYQEEFDFIQKQIAAPLIQFCDLSVYDKSYSTEKKEIRLGHNKNNLDFQFKAISFINEKQLSYHYKLEGYEKDWSSATGPTEMQLRYTNLKPGTYQLLVRAKNDVGLWSREIQSPVIYIEKPFWTRWWFLVVAFLILGLVVYSLGRNISQRRYSALLERQVQKRTLQLKESEAQYRTTIDSMPDAIHVIDEGFTVLVFNKKFYQWNQKLGLDPNAVGKHLFDVFPFLSDKVRQEYLDVFRSAKNHKIINTLAINKQHITTETFKIPVLDANKVVRVVTVVKDITEQVKAQQELAKLQALLLASIEQTPAGIIIADAPDATIRIANSNALTLRGKSEKSLTEIPYQAHAENWQFYHLNGKLYDSEKLPLSRAIRKGEVVNNETVIIKRDDGENRFMLTNAAPVKDDNGKIIAGVVVFSDITDLKDAEEKLKASLKDKEILIKEVHHRVKNNLQVISSLLHLQSGYIQDGKLLEMFQDSQYRIRSMALVHEKLYRSKNLTKVNFGEYIQSLAHNLFRAYQINTNRIKLKLNVSKIGLNIEYAIPCGLIINELITNSLKYAFPKSIDKTGLIEISLGKINSQQIELVLKDNGVGLPDDIDFRKTQSLGLKLVSSLVENQLEGTIALDQAAGTTFRITFGLAG